MNPKLLIFIIISIIILSCNNLQKENRQKCKYDTLLLTYYLRDLNNILDYENSKFLDSQSILHLKNPRRSLLNLEVLTSNSTNIDSILRVAIENHQSFTMYLSKWIKWIEIHKCYTIDSARYLFDNSNELNKTSSDLVNKEELEQFKLKIPLDNYRHYNSTELDSILTFQIIQMRKSFSVGW